MIVETRVAAVHPPGNRTYVLLPGLGLSSCYLKRLAAALAFDAEVWIADFRLLKNQPPKERWTVATIAGIVAEWMKARGLAPAIILGHSFGAQVAVELALRAPQLLESIVLVSPTVDPSARTFRQQFGRLLCDAPLESPRLLAIAGFDYLRNLRHVRKAVWAALHDAMEHSLPLLKMPALVIRGARDGVVPAKWTARVTHLLPGGQLFTLPKAAHGVVFTAFREVADAVRQFAANRC